MPKARAPTPRLKNSPAYLVPKAEAEKRSQNPNIRKDFLIIIRKLIYERNSINQEEIDTITDVKNGYILSCIPFRRMRRMR
jgi:hypothetical protein